MPGADAGGEGVTKKGYIRRGISGWSVAFWNGQNEVRYLHGFPSWGEALGGLKEHWAEPPDYQNGFCTVVDLSAA